MHIDSIPTKIKASAIPFSIFTGTKYVFVYSDGNHSTPGDPYGYTPKYDWENGISVLFSKKELKNFLPNNTTHNFRLSLLEEQKNEIARLKQLIPKAKINYIPQNGDKTPINLKQRYKDRVKFLEENTIVLLEIDFVNNHKDETNLYYN